MKRLFLLLISLLVNCSLFSNPIDLLSRIEKNFNHTQTYYWYGRYKNNTLKDFRLARQYLEYAEQGYDSLVTYFPEQAEEKKYLKEEFKTLKETLNAVEEICIENMNGRYPIYNLIKGKNSTLEFWDDTNEIALEAALQNLIAIPYPNKLVSEQMLFSIIISEPNDLFMEEVANQYLTNNSNHLVESRYKLLEFVTEKEIHDLSDTLKRTPVLKKICMGLGIEKLGLFTIYKEDQVDGLYYWTARFTTFNNDGSFSSLIKADGFREDRIGVKVLSTYFSLAYLVVLVVLFLFLFIFSIWLRKERVKLSEGILITRQSLIYFLISLVAGIIISTLLTLVIRPLMPSGDEFFKSVESRLIWNVLYPLALSLAPIIISYILASRFYNRGLHGAENMFAVFSGAAVSYLVLILFYQTILHGKIVFDPELLFAAALILVLCYAISIAYRKFFIRKQSIYAWIILSFVVSLFLIPSFLFISGEGLDLKWTNALIMLTPSILGILIFLVYLGISRSSLSIKNKKVSTGQSVAVKLNSIEDLRLFFDAPPSLVPITNSEGGFIHLKNLTDQLFAESEGMNLYQIRGPRGIGKTRFIKNLQHFLESDNNYVVFYGDCDEFQDADIIPYEPFVEALGEQIGLGAFTNHNKQVGAVVQTLKDLDIGPVSALASFLGGSEDHDDGADPHEVLNELMRIFKQLQLDGNRVLLIIEDVQWMDDTTKGLLMLLINTILMNTSDYKSFRLLLTIRDDDITDVKNIPLFNELEQIGHAFLNINDISESILNKFSYSNYFSSLLELNSIHFNYYSETALIKYFDQNDYKIPLHFNQIMINIIDKGWITKDQDEFKLSSDANLDELLPPDDISKIYREKFDKLDPKLLKILISAAYIGMSFEARILASVWWGLENAENKLLDLFHNLQEAERLGLVIDKSEQDDVYEFTSRGLMSELRSYNEINPKLHYNIDPKKGEIALPQAVKEYHKRIIAALEVYKGKMIDLDINLLCSIAKRCRYLDLKNETNRSRLIKYSTLAGERLSKATRLVEAIDFYDSAYNALSKKDHQSDGDDALTKKRALIIKILQVLLDSSRESDGSAYFDDELFQGHELQPEYLNLKALILFRTKAPAKAILDVMDEFRALNKSGVSPIQDLRARFNIILANSLIKPEGERELMEINEQVIKELTLLLKDIENNNQDDTSIQELKGEVLNNLANKYIPKKSPKALEYLDKRTLTILGIDSEEIPFKDYRRIEILTEQLKLQELSAHGRVSMKFNIGAYASYYSSIGDLEKQIQYLKLTINANEELGDQKFLSIYSMHLGDALCKLEKPPLDEIFKIYYETYWGAKMTDLGAGFSCQLVNRMWNFLQKKRQIADSQCSQKNHLDKIVRDYLRTTLPTVVFSAPRQYHILRHFEVADENYLLELAETLSRSEGNEINMNSIQAQLRLKGSKFDAKFCDNPQALWHKIISCTDCTISSYTCTKDSKLIFSLVFSKDTYSDGIGTDALIALADLDDEMRKSIRIEKRDKYDIQVVNLKKPKRTWSFVVILSLREKNPEVITIHPGAQAPPFPDTELQDVEDYKKNQTFWKEHAFIAHEE